MTDERNPGDLFFLNERVTEWTRDRSRNNRSDFVSLPVGAPYVYLGTRHVKGVDLVYFYCHVGIVEWTTSFWSSLDGPRG